MHLFLFKFEYGLNNNKLFVTYTNIYTHVYKRRDGYSNNLLNVTTMSSYSHWYMWNSVSKFHKWNECIKRSACRNPTRSWVFALGLALCQVNEVCDVYGLPHDTLVDKLVVAPGPAGVANVADIAWGCITIANIHEYVKCQVTQMIKAK